MMLKCHAKNEAKNQAILKMFYVKESSNLIHRENLDSKFQEPAS